MKNFEERLANLEDISERMRSGDIPLNEALEAFETGIELAKQLDSELSGIERRIEILINRPQSPDEKPILELFPDLSNYANEESDDSDDD